MEWKMREEKNRRNNETEGTQREAGRGKEEKQV